MQGEKTTELHEAWYKFNLLENCNYSEVYHQSNLANILHYFNSIFQQYKTYKKIM